MAEKAIGMGLQAVPIVTQHYHKVWNPIQNQYNKMTGNAPVDDPDTKSSRGMEDKGYYLRRRSEVGPNEEIVETVRHRGEVKARKPGRPPTDRRSSSMNGTRDGNNPRGYGGGYDSEGSVPPRSRVRAKSQGGSRKRGSSSSSTSSSDLKSSTDEEKEVRKIARKKWITAALASVATIHAASKVYSSIENHDKRILAVQAGEMSPEEAHKKQRSARWQDAAAIGIAALGIKGAISEWNEVQEEHSHHREMLEKREEHHQKRLERARRERAREQGGYYKGRDGNWYYDGREPQDSEKSRQLDGPRSGERKMLEAPGRSRAQSMRGDNRDDYRDKNNGRSRSRRGRDDDDYDYARSDRRRNSTYARDDNY